MSKTKKSCDASIRVLQTLLFLSKTPASINEIIKYFEKIDPQNRSYTSEVILKYINTLKVFGFCFEKQKGQYILLNIPPSFEFDENEIKGLQILEKYANVFPENKIKDEINEFLQNIEHRFSKNSSILAHNIKKPACVIMTDNAIKYQKQISQFEQYCKAQQRIKICFKKDGNEIKLTAEPTEIKYEENRIYFTIYTPSDAQIHDIEINSIVSIEQLPTKVSSMSLMTNFTFLLKGRLAKIYKLKSFERLSEIRENGDIVIINKKEDKDVLLHRLMRYGAYCEVLTPVSLREEMQELIKSTLKNYEDLQN